VQEVYVECDIIGDHYKSLPATILDSAMMDSTLEQSCYLILEGFNHTRLLSDFARQAPQLCFFNELMIEI
jgi:hypothetical protein